MTWKDFFAPIGIILTVLLIFSFVLSFIMYQQFGKATERVGLVQIIEASCITNSHYDLTLENTSAKNIEIDKLNFSVDGNKIICQGIDRLEPNSLAKCRIEQFVTPGYHSLRIEGKDRFLLIGKRTFSVSKGVRCD